MDLKLKAGLLFLCSLILTACLDFTTDDDKENADACADGDEAACEQLDEDLEIATEACQAGDTQSCARAAALQALIASIPTGLVIASSTDVTDAGNTSALADKQGDIEDFLNNTSLTGTALDACFEALPQQPQVSSPLCYGPAVDYVQHPDATVSDPTSGQLPTGDLGLWVEDEPGSNTACAAAKLNELVAKAAYNVDLAVGSMTMMVCAAAMLDRELPTQSGEKLDLGNALGSVSNSSFKVKTAVIELATLSNGHTAYKTHLEAKDNNDQPIELSVTHDAEDDSGVLLIRTTESGGDGAGGDPRGTSVVYSISDTSLQYKMVSARSQHQGQANSLRDGDSDIATTSTGEVSLHSGQDIHVMIANMNPSTGDGSLAYAWNAGGADDHYRTLNVSTSGTTGRAYYGYVPSPAAASETINLDLSHADAGMICNWAGPGNQHQTNEKVQYQALSLTSGEWTATTSNIVYAPTNDCDLPAASSSFTPTFAGPGVSNPPAPTADQQEVIDNGTVTGPMTNDLLNKTSIIFTMPTAPTAPQ